MLDERAVDCPSQTRVLIGNRPSLVSDVVKYVLKSSFAEELIPCAEWYLNDGAKLRKLSTTMRAKILYVRLHKHWSDVRIVLNIGDALRECAIRPV